MSTSAVINFNSSQKGTCSGTFTKYDRAGSLTVESLKVKELAIQIMRTGSRQYSIIHSEPNLPNAWYQFTGKFKHSSGEESQNDFTICTQVKYVKAPVESSSTDSSNLLVKKPESDDFAKMETFLTTPSPDNEDWTRAFTNAIYAQNQCALCGRRSFSLSLYRIVATVLRFFGTQDDDNTYIKKYVAAVRTFGLQARDDGVLTKGTLDAANDQCCYIK